MTTPLFPIERELVPASAPSLRGATAETQRLVKGLPESLSLDTEISLVVALPTGLATTWRDADPAAVVSSSDAELSAASPAPQTPVGDVARAPVRLFVMQNGNPIASVPLAAGLHRLVGEDGATLELRIVAWHIHAGNLLGSGDLGSFLQLEWRRVGTASSEFATPPLDPHVAQRLGRQFRLESLPGVTG